MLQKLNDILEAEAIDESPLLEVYRRCIVKAENRFSKIA